MNLHGIASGAISAVNPMTPITVQVNQGYQTGTSGRRQPTFGTPITGVSAQVQSETFNSLSQKDGTIVQGLRRVIYVTGLIQAALRFTQQGGDLVTFPDGSVWLTEQVLELWPDWCKIAVTLQNGS